MRIPIPLMMSFVSACATNGLDGPRPVHPPVAMSGSTVPAIRTVEHNAATYPGDIVQLIDSRTIRALRAARNDIPTLDLTREQKIALWVGVGLVAAYLITDWIEDEVAFFP